MLGWFFVNDIPMASSIFTEPWRLLKLQLYHSFISKHEGVLYIIWLEMNSKHLCWSQYGKKRLWNKNKLQESLGRILFPLCWNYHWSSWCWFSSGCDIFWKDWSQPWTPTQNHPNWSKWSLKMYDHWFITSNLIHIGFAGASIPSNLHPYPWLVPIT